MALVDSQCHVSPIWYEPVETLLEQMDRNGVAQAVLVQLLGQYHNAYQQQCLRRYPGRFASVVAVDVGLPGACDALVRLAAEGATGVRLRPTARSQGEDSHAIWRTAEAQGLAVSCVGDSEAFARPEFAAIVARFDGLPIVLEHFGGTSRADSGDAASRERVFELAEFPNVYLKLPGLGELAPRSTALPESGLPLEAVPPILRSGLRRFGPDRLMWGSDFPPVAAREGYANALGWVRETLADQSEDAQANIFGGTAAQVFKLPAA